ncbi:MAG: ABC transporter permease, partial [Opitutaceae bacterium]
DEARYAARRQFGGVDQIKEQARAQRPGLWLEQLLQDLRYATRQLRRNPGFASVAILSLALGIGANTAIFSFVDAVLLKLLPVKDPRELVLFNWASKQGWVGPVSGSWEKDPATGLQTCTSFSQRAFELFRDRNATLAAVFAFAPLGNVTLIVDGQAESSSFGGQFISVGYHAGLGVSPVVGRVMTPEDDRPGAAPVVVISHRYWQQRFAGDPAAVGKTISVNGALATIIGVTPRGFLGALDVGIAPDVSLPLAMLAQVDPEFAGMANRPGGMWWLRVMGRLKPDATREQVRANLGGTFRELAMEEAKLLPARGTAGTGASPEIPVLGVEAGGQGLTEARHGHTRMLVVLMSLVGLVLLLACANVAGLLVARGAARRREIAARLAMGAGRGRLVRQLLTESALLVLCGAIAGIFVAHWGQSALLALNPLAGRAAQPVVLNPTLDWRVLGFTAVAALVSALLVGLVPAWRATRVEIQGEFLGGMRNQGAGRSRIGQAFLLVQVALSLVLLVGAGLFVRTLRNLQGVDVGFNREQLLLFAVNAKPPTYDATRAAALHARVAETIRTISGVRAATFSRLPLLSNAGWNTRIAFPDRPPPATGKADTAMLNAVEPAFFSTLEIPVLLGRGFTDADAAKSLKVALINETMARQYFPEQNPIGRSLIRNAPSGRIELEVVGIVRDAKYAAVKNQTPATFYVPFSQESSGEASYAVRTSGDPKAFIGSIRAALRAIDAELPLADIRTQEQQVEKLLGNERLFARASGFFGVLALVLVGVGLYGLMSYAVTCRTGEIGIRIALGAMPRAVLWMILRESLVLVIVGAVLGAAVAAGMTALVKNMLYGVAPTDPLTFGGVTLLLLAAALFAAWLPARRAAKLDPVVALRAE